MDKKKLFYRLLILFPITTVMQGMMEWINQALFAGVFILLIYLFFVDRRLNKNELILFFLLALNHFYAIYKTRLPIYHVNMLFYLMFFFLYSLYLSDNGQDLIEYFKEDHRYVMTQIILWNIVVGISIFLPSSYHYAWGRGIYFSSFTINTFRLSPTAFMMLILVLHNFILFREKWTLILTVVPLYCFYMGGSRTFLAAGVLAFLIILYMLFPRPSYFYLALVPVVAIAILAIGFTAAGEKIAATSYSSNSYFDYWATITSGRTIFWKADIQSFFNESFLDQLLGCGFNYVYDINNKYFNAIIWAHNDLINVLLNFGYLGILIYLYVMAKIFAIVRSAREKVPMILLGLIFAIWLITAMFNMYYTYFCTLISFPMLLALVSNQQRGREVCL